MCNPRVFKLVYLFYFSSFPFPLIHHHFCLLNILFSLFLPHILYVSGLFIISLNSFSLLPSHSQTPGSKLSLSLPHSPPPLVLSLTFHPYLPYIVNSRGASGQPVSLPLSTQIIHHLLSLCFLFLRISPQPSIPAIRLFLALSHTQTFSLCLPC
jgi:hypothetical protein